MKTLKRFLYTFWIKKPKIINGSKYYLAKQRWKRVRVAVNFVARAYDLQSVTNFLQCWRSAQNYRSFKLSYILIKLATYADIYMGRVTWR